MQADTEFAFLGDIADFEMGQSPDSSFVNDAGIGIPFLQGNAEFGPVSPTHRSYCSRPKKLCRPGDVLISVRAPVGALNKADRVYCIGRGLAAIGFHGVLPDYGWHLLNYWAPNLRIVAQGTTFEAVGKTELLSLRVVRLPEPEQRRIADILDAADAAIRQTDALIAKLKQIKAGLLHDLLTRGLDAHGRLRDPVAHPEQFVESPVGRIPKEWKIGAISDIALNHDSRRVPLRQSDRDRMHGIHPYYGASGIIDFVDDYIFDGDFVLLGEDGENVISRQLPLAFRAKGKFWVNNHAHVYEPLPGTDIRFLTELLEAIDYQAIISGSAQPKLTQNAIIRLRLVIPSSREQGLIGDVLDAHDARIHAEEAYRDKLVQVKRGLMEDLLTGRVRVV